MTPRVGPQAEQNCSVPEQLAQLELYLPWALQHAGVASREQSCHYTLAL